jgi:hypothetical protein
MVGQYSTPIDSGGEQRFAAIASRAEIESFGPTGLHVDPAYERPEKVAGSCFDHISEAVGVKAEQFVYLPWKFSISIVDGPPMKAWHAVLIKPRRGGEQA